MIRLHPINARNYPRKLSLEENWALSSTPTSGSLSYELPADSSKKPLESRATYAKNSELWHYFPQEVSTDVFELFLAEIPIDFLSDSREFVNGLSDEGDQRERASHFLDSLHQSARKLMLKGFNTNSIPKLIPSLDADGSILFEWYKENSYRIGFAVDLDPADSSWYWITHVSAGLINARGHLMDGGQTEFITSLLVFVILNSTDGSS